MKKIMFVWIISILTFISNSVNAQSPNIIEIVDADKKQVIDVIMSDYTGWGWNIGQVTDYSVSFFRDSDKFWTNVFFGSQFNGTPELRVQFNVIQAGKNVRVTANGKIVTNPHSGYEKHNPIEPKQFVSILEALRKRFNGWVGYGFSVRKKDEFREVIKISPNSSVERAKINIGDKITHINGKLVDDLDDDDYAKELSGPEGSVVTLTLKTISGEERTVTLTKTFIPGEYQKKP